MKEIENTSGVGHIQISGEVVSIIAGTATLEIEEVAGMNGSFTNGISVRLGRKNLSKGVKVLVENNSVSIDISLIVKFGCKVQDVCKAVQEKVKIAVETMTGLKVVAINVNVSDIDYEKQDIEEKQEDLL